MTALVSVERIANKIYLIRKKKVMLDRDLAELYGVETKVLKQAVRRNIERFPEVFMFQLTDEEFASVSSANPPIIPRYDIYTGEISDWVNQKWTEMLTE